MFHLDRKLQQQESDTSSASDSTTDVISRIGVITPTEDKEVVESDKKALFLETVAKHYPNTVTVEELEKELENKFDELFGSLEWGKNEK